MELNDKELLRLLKHGRAEELAELAEEMKPTYADSFPAFMDQMLKEHHLKRSTVARRSGLSQDYLYKLLRGDKRTTERDYIIAICMAAGLNIAQTQHALRIYGMPLLDRKDLRSNIIYVNIDEGASIDALNDRLEKVRLPILRTSPEMEKAVIAPNAAIEAEKKPEVDKPIFVGEVEEIGSQVHAEHCGNAPFDFAYWAEIHLEDEQKHQFRVQAYYDPISSGFTAMTEEQFQANEALRKEVKPGEAEPFEKYQMLEWYETLAEAAVSPFFSWFWC